MICWNQSNVKLTTLAKYVWLVACCGPWFNIGLWFTNSSKLFADGGMKQKRKKEYFQSLPHIRTDEVAFRKRKNKNFRFSGEKDITKKADNAGSRDRTKSDDELVFSGWDKSNASTPTKTSSQSTRDGVNNVSELPQRSVSNNFLYSSQAFNSLQKSSTGSRGPPRTTGFKLDYNLLMKKAVAANARGTTNYIIM